MLCQRLQLRGRRSHCKVLRLTGARPWLEQLATWRMFSVYNSHSLERAALGSHKHSQPVDSGLLRARDALQHFRAEERDGVRLVGLHGV